MRARSALLEALGDEEGCRRLSAAFYARVGKDPVLRPFFPGKSLRCATEEFAAFLIQFLGGDETQTQYRWWLSLRESHARFQIGPNAQRAWLRQMEATLDAAPLDDATRNALRYFFSRSSAYVIGRDTAESDHEELAARWREQRVLDTVIAAIVEVRALVRAGADVNACGGVTRATALHMAARRGYVEIARALLDSGAAVNARDRKGDTPLQRAINCHKNGVSQLLRKRGAR